MYGKYMTWPLVAIHATVARSGDLITYGTPVGQKVQGAVKFDNWNPASNTHVQSPEMNVDSFCNIGVVTESGKLMMAGGNSQMTSGVYDPVTRTYTGLPNFAYPRWYASMIRLPDDRYVVVGGAQPKVKEGEVETRFSSTPEVLEPGATNWTPLPGATSVTLFGSPDYAWWYPKAYLAPDGDVFGISQNRLWKLDPDGNGSVQQVGTVPGTGFGSSASSVMYAPGKILLAGGGQEINTDGGVASKQASIIDINGATPSVVATDSMSRPRNWANLTILPNGEVVATGGTEDGVDGTAVKPVEIWNPTTRQWRTGAAALKIRTYHSTGTLLPSGAVFIGGGGVPGPVTNLNAEIYYPPQLFTTDATGQVKWANRPEFRDVSGTIARGGTATFGMKDARQIASVSLTSAGSVTHSYSVDLRRVPLDFSQDGNHVTVRFPTSATMMPPGVYLLHAVDANGVPAPSQIIEITSDGSPGPITVYGDGSVVPPGSGGTTVSTTTVPTTTVPTTTVPTTTVVPSTTVAPSTTAPTTTAPTTTVATTTTVPTTPVPGTTIPLPSVGLAARWSLDEGAGTSATDSSGDGNNGTLLNGVTWVAGRSGTATAHTGATDQQIRVPSSASFDRVTAGVTMSAWIRPTSLTASFNQAIVSRQFGTGSGDQWYISLNNGSPTVGVNTVSGGPKKARATLNAVVGRWTHVAGTYDGTKIKLYVNGSLVASVAQAGAIVSEAKPVIIGGNQNDATATGAQELFRGSLDDVSVYDRALSAAEVAQLAG